MPAVRRSLDARLDHVAIATRDRDEALAYWRDEAGGGLVSGDDHGAFATWQVRFRGGGKLELLGPSARRPQDGFLARYLSRFGPGIHHVTLKVDDLAVAIDVLRRGGIEPVDVDLASPIWKEAFLRPSAVGGLVVQVAQAAYDDEGWAASVGVEPAPARADAATFEGVRLRHPDLEAAGALWRLLGGTVAAEGDGLVVRWPHSPLTVALSPGGPAGAVALRFVGPPAGSAAPPPATAVPLEVPG